MPGIFISYRRSDAAGHAGRLFDRLQSHFGANFVFRDVDDIADGDTFPAAISSALETCHIVLVVMGATWATVPGEDGQRRLSNRQDWVRRETATAMGKGTRVIPVLVGGARMPGANDLPDDLKPLIDLSARTLDDTDWDADVRRLIDALEKVAGARAPRRTGLLKVAAGLLALALASMAAFWIFSTEVPHLVGRSADEARQLAAEARLTIVREVRQPSETQPRGHVIAQTPEPGRRMGNANLALVVADRVTVDLSEGFDVRDQGQEGAGPAFAMATAMSASFARQNRPVRLSPRYLYEKARALDTDLDRSEQGVRVEYIQVVARDHGVPPEDAWPYKALERRPAARIPWAALDRAAAPYKADLVAAGSLDAVHGQLRQGRYVVAVIRGAETWNDAGIATSGQIPINERPDPAYAHVIVIVAMGGAHTPVRFANSWGAGWGDRGFGTMTEAVANRMLTWDQVWGVVVREGK
jgi:hypothetical protein